MNNQKVISEFRLKGFGSKGWVRGELFCPECSKGDKFGVLFTGNGGVCRCFYCSKSYPLWQILKSIGRGDLLDFDYEYKESYTLPSLKEEKKKEDDQGVSLPIGFKYIYQNEYLEERGFTPDQFVQFKVGVAELDPKTENSIVFQIYQKGELAGWLSRSTYSKEWHHENLKRHKEFDEPLVLRYRNSENDFAKMLGGLDEITKNTHTVILVEGLMDKANLDRVLRLNDDESIKCCFTFGSDLSVEQVDLIPNHIQEVILMYDKGTLSNMREAGGRLMSLFNVKVALIEDEDVDPGNITEKYLVGILLCMKDFLYFYSQIE